jgi:hypothetical protein
MNLEEKFLVLKIADIEQALTSYERRVLARLAACVWEYREHQGKPQHRYVVINQDEPYFPDVLKLMEEQERHVEEDTQTHETHTAARRVETPAATDL